MPRPPSPPPSPLPDPTCCGGITCSTLECDCGVLGVDFPLCCPWDDPVPVYSRALGIPWYFASLGVSVPWRIGIPIPIPLCCGCDTRPFGDQDKVPGVDCLLFGCGPGWQRIMCRTNYHRRTKHGWRSGTITRGLCHKTTHERFFENRTYSYTTITPSYAPAAPMEIPLRQVAPSQPEQPSPARGVVSDAAVAGTPQPPATLETHDGCTLSSTPNTNTYTPNAMVNPTATAKTLPPVPEAQTGAETAHKPPSTSEPSAPAPTQAAPVAPVTATTSNAALAEPHTQLSTDKTQA